MFVPRLIKRILRYHRPKNGIFEISLPQEIRMNGKLLHSIFEMQIPDGIFYLFRC